MLPSQVAHRKTAWIADARIYILSYFLFVLLVHLSILIAQTERLTVYSLTSKLCQNKKTVLTFSFLKGNQCVNNYRRHTKSAFNVFLLGCYAAKTEHWCLIYGFETVQHLLDPHVTRPHVTVGVWIRARWYISCLAEMLEKPLTYKEWERGSPKSDKCLTQRYWTQR